MQTRVREQLEVTQALQDPLPRLGEVQRPTWIRVTPQCAIQRDQAIADQADGPAQVPGNGQAPHAGREWNRSGQGSPHRKSITLRPVLVEQ